MASSDVPATWDQITWSEGLPFNRPWGILVLRVMGCETCFNPLVAWGFSFSCNPKKTRNLKLETRRSITAAVIPHALSPPTPAARGALPCKSGLRRTSRCTSRSTWYAIGTFVRMNLTYA